MALMHGLTRAETFAALHIGDNLEVLRTVVVQAAVEAVGLPYLPIETALL